ncbi:hypothetical protein RclHR1_06610005 [Rhizophagus clarus]|uniref:HAT C-terminal dimerisation domain-containing protein n=1 Tax=Rhizophagus clarus TaxID=94130 RepID=A0A2Z6SAG7_9GLOM|nr:hypothetical protein RclHR1_06610005 [Rhizophagus clarus]
MLIKPGETCWNSYYFCYQSVFKNKRALKSLAGRNDLSDITVIQDEEENNGSKLMASKIISIIDNPDFWLNLIELEKILYPYYAALNLLQKDKAQLYDILHSFGYFMQCTLECNDENYKEMITMGYIKWFGKNPTTIVRELLAYKKKHFPFNESSLLELEQIPLDYWSFLSDSVPELSQVATKLFSICVNSVSCECLFFSMCFLHTKRQNNLNYSKWHCLLGDEEINDAILEPPELNVDDIDIDDNSDNENDEETNEFIKL